MQALSLQHTLVQHVLPLVRDKLGQAAAMCNVAAAALHRTRDTGGGTTAEEEHEVVKAALHAAAAACGWEEEPLAVNPIALPLTTLWLMTRAKVCPASTEGARAPFPLPDCAAAAAHGARQHAACVVASARQVPTPPPPPPPPPPHPPRVPHPHVLLLATGAPNAAPAADGEEHWEEGDSEGEDWEEGWEDEADTQFYVGFASCCDVPGLRLRIGAEFTQTHSIYEHVYEGGAWSDSHSVSALVCD